jgi:hypothetical protein
MFYQAFAGIPEWAQPRENHILYSEGILKAVQYNRKEVKYNAASENGIEYLRLSFKPARISVNGKEISERKLQVPDAYLLRRLGGGDYALTLKHSEQGDVLITG